VSAKSCSLGGSETPNASISAFSCALIFASSACRASRSLRKSASTLFFDSSDLNSPAGCCSASRCCEPSGALPVGAACWPACVEDCVSGFDAPEACSFGSLESVIQFLHLGNVQGRLAGLGQ